jgi:hypothetical protein
MNGVHVCQGTVGSQVRHGICQDKLAETLMGLGERNCVEVDEYLLSSGFPWVDVTMQRVITPIHKAKEILEGFFCARHRPVEAFSARGLCV